MGRKMAFFFILSHLVTVTSGSLDQPTPRTVPIDKSREWWFDDAKAVCSCNSQSSTRSHNLTASKCEEIYKNVSSSVYQNMISMTKNWADRCDRPHEAFQQSLLNRGDPSKLVKFKQKLESCVEGSDPVSVVIFGGSETRGSWACEGRMENDFLNIPFETISVKALVRGTDDCPWSNRFKALLSATYPRCDHIDVYNLAAKSSFSTWILDRMPQLLSVDNGSRNGRPLGEVADLVVVEYGVNDGFRKPILPDEDVEPVAENVMKFLEGLPSNPAVMYVELASLSSDRDATPYYLEAASKLSVPLVDVKRVLSFPADPRWIKFDPKNGTALYPSSFKDEEGHVIGVEKVDPVSGKKMRPPICWGSKMNNPHPGKTVHNMVAKALFYFIEVETQMANITLPLCR